MTFHAPRKFKPSVGLLADEFPEPWLPISQVEAEQGDLRGRHRPPLRAIPGFSLPTSRLDRRVELPTIGIVSIRGVALCPLSEAYDDLRRFWPTCTYGGHGPTSARFLRAQLDGQRDYEPVVAALENVLVESPRLGELHGVLEHLRRVRLEDQLLAPAEGSVVIVAFEGGRNVALPKVQIPVRITFKGLLGQSQRSEEPTHRLLAYCRRYPERDHELALRQLTQPSRLGDRDLRVKEIGCLNLPLLERYQALPRPAGVHGLYVLLRQHLAQGLQGCEVTAGHLPDTNRHVPKFVEPFDPGVRTHEDSVAPHTVEVGHDSAHTGARVAGGAPLAGRVGDLLLLDEREILGASTVLVASVARDRMHNVGKHVGL